MTPRRRTRRIRRTSRALRRAITVTAILAVLGGAALAAASAGVLAGADLGEPTDRATSPSAPARPAGDDPTPTTEPPAPTTTTTTAPPTTTTTAPPAPTTWRQGDSGPEVLTVQQRLTDLGYRPGAVDGHFGAQTASAVLAFQKREGLGRDGVVGPEVLGRLAAPQGAGPRDTASDHVEIDLERQIVFAVFGGQVTTINTSTGNNELYTTPSGGTARAVTPTGSYAVERRIDGVRQAPLGDLYRPLYFNGGVALHGSPSVPAYAASHGCARTSNADQDWLFDRMPNGMPVVVY